MYNEQNLITALRSGDAKAFDALFRKYAPKLYFLALSFVPGTDQAEEIVQETFVRIWEARHRIDPERNFGPYMVSIAKRILYNVVRHTLVEQKYNRQAARDSDDSYTIEDELAIRSFRERMLEGIGNLPPQQREILTLKSEGFDNEEIALRLHLSKRTVETHINKAFRYLRVFLADSRAALSVILFSGLS